MAVWTDVPIADVTAIGTTEKFLEAPVAASQVQRSVVSVSLSAHATETITVFVYALNQGLERWMLRRRTNKA